MAFDAYLKIDGIPGESTDDKHKDWIQIDSFHHGMSQSASSTRSSAGGASSGRTDHADFNINKLLDKASPILYQACSSGKHLASVVVEFWRAAGDAKVKFLEIKMEEVMVSSVAPGGGKESDFPTESVSFNYGKIKWTYTQQKRKDGAGGGSTTGGWDLTSNKVNS